MIVSPPASSPHRHQSLPRSGCRPTALLAAFVTAMAAIAEARAAAPLDINALVTAGQASVTTSRIDIGSRQAIFDGDTSSLARSQSVNPMLVTITFKTPRQLGSCAAFFSHAAQYRWRAATAETLTDLNKRSGTYRDLTGWVDAGDRVWSAHDLTDPGPFTYLRLEAERLVGDNYVHLNEWSLFEPRPPFVITRIERAPSDGVLLAWSTTADATYAVETAGAGGAWTPAAAAPGTGETVEWTDPAPAAVARFYRVLEVAREAIDLDATYIERTPRYDYDGAQGWPAAGDPVTFHAHVVNWSPIALTDVRCDWAIEDEPAGTVTLPALNPGEERVLTLDWTWGPAETVSFAVDPEDRVAELSETNNRRDEAIHGLAVGFWVERSLYDYFQAHQSRLGLGSNSWEDWAQRQVAINNQFFAEALYPLTPQGILDRWRIDKIVVVPDGALPLNGGLPTNHPDLRDKTVDLMWGFPATLLGDPNFYAVRLDSAFNFEGSLLHELGHARYLIDTYGFDVAQGQVEVTEGGSPVAGSPLMPLIAWDVVYYNKNGKMMSGGYGDGYDEYSAAALNRIAGQRARGGNYNAPSTIGEFLQELPASNHFRFVTGRTQDPLPGAMVRVYQATAASGWYGKRFDDTFDLEYTADAEGWIHLPRNPFTYDPDTGAMPIIRHTYGITNGIMLLRIEHAGRVWYRFQEVTDFNRAYWAGRTESAEYVIPVD